MLQSNFSHIQFNIHPQNLPFYKDLFAFLGWKTLGEYPDMLGVGCDSYSLWMAGIANEAKNDYDGPGFNHIGLQVQSQAAVDQMVAYLAERSIPALFETPRHRPEFCADTEQTYYQVMFESPDKILIEVVYMGQKEG